MQKLTFYSTIFILAFVWNTNAQNSDSTKTEDDGKLTVSGYVDAYYNWAFNKPYSGSLLGMGGAGRAFDRTVDQFSLGLVQTKFTYSGSKYDIVADLTFGPNAELGNFGNVNNAAYSGGGIVGANLYQHPVFGNLYGTSAAIKQAYGTWKATDKLSFTVGQFGTHIGYEVIDAPVNYNYSLSNLFNNGPFYHVGAKVNYSISDKMAAMVGLVNNWDNLFDNNKQKSLIAQYYVNPTDGWNLYLNYIGGAGDDGFFASAYPDLVYNRHLFDVTTGYQLTKKFYVGLNFAYGMYTPAGNEDTEDFFNSSITDSASSKPDWGGVALYSNYAIKDWLGVGFRYERFEDSYGVRYLGGAVGGAVNNSYTLTIPLTLANGHFILKPEFRLDSSPQEIYEGKYDEDTGVGKPIKQQMTFGLASIFKF
ncbi:MAG: porin [Cytophagaceae bacterium]|nr:porin [Cytophagaceae bacterium]MDW8456667.1 outer membrane beta-barrel protein [Cytophagaceae bacterium]